MDLQTAANIAEILGAASILTALIFGLIEIRQFNRQRQDAAAIELVRSFEDESFTHAYLMISSLPEDVSAADLTADGERYEQAALSIGMKYETVGLLVYRGVVPLEDVDDLVGGAASTLWARLRPWVEARRTQTGHGTFLEWFQWLVLRLERARGGAKVPAFETRA